MGWLAVLGFAALAFGALLRWGRLPRSGLELAGAALLVGIAGYAWQGRPSLAPHPVVHQQELGTTDPQLLATRRSMMGGFGAEAQWLDFSDALGRMGDTKSAVTAIKSGLREQPGSADLWTGLGNALVAHGKGLVSPAAAYAFEHAAQLSPNHPGPPFFYGLALANAGQTAQAGQIWRGLLTRAPDGAPWKADLTARLAAINELPTEPAKPSAPAS